MGLPVDKLVCASNDNNVLTEFFTTGTYDANREFFKTISPSMDILISSNLERLVFELSNRDFKVTEERMNNLKKVGKYAISTEEKTALDKEFFAECTDEEDCSQTIADFFDEYGYVLDPHTAVAVNVANKFVDVTKNQNSTVVLSTASPYKFAHDVLKAIDGNAPVDAFKSAYKLNEETAFPIPEQILSLKEKEKRFTKVINRDETVDAVIEFIKK